jgi:hypothetical protein
MMDKDEVTGVVFSATLTSDPGEPQTFREAVNEPAKEKWLQSTKDEVWQQTLKNTTKGWEILIQWKDGSSTRVSMKDVNNSYPVQLAKNAMQRQIAGEPAFTWRIQHVLHKQNIITAKLKTKDWVRSHKFGVTIPKRVKEAKKFHKNGNTFWWDTICKKMKKVGPAYR